MCSGRSSVRPKAPRSVIFADTAVRWVNRVQCLRPPRAITLYCFRPRRVAYTFPLTTIGNSPIYIYKTALITFSLVGILLFKRRSKCFRYVRSRPVRDGFVDRHRRSGRPAERPVPLPVKGTAGRPRFGGHGRRA